MVVHNVVRVKQNRLPAKLIFVAGTRLLGVNGLATTTIKGLTMAPRRFMRTSFHPCKTLTGGHYFIDSNRCLVYRWDMAQLFATQHISTHIKANTFGCATASESVYGEWSTCPTYKRDPNGSAMGLVRSSAMPRLCRGAKVERRPDRLRLSFSCSPYGDFTAQDFPSQQPVYTTCYYKGVLIRGNAIPKRGGAR